MQRIYEHIRLSKNMTSTDTPSTWTTYQASVNIYSLGVTHQADVPYVWGYPLLVRFEEVMEDSQLYMPEEFWTHEERKFSKFMQTL